MALTLSDEFLDTTGMTELEVKLELACVLYKNLKLSFGKAKSFAGLNYQEFNKELLQRKIYLHYNEQDLQDDFDTLERVNLNL